MKKYPRLCELCGDYKSYSYFDKNFGFILCNGHRNQFKKYGYFLPIRKQKNSYTIKKDTAYLDLYNKKENIISYAIIDKEDIEKCLISKLCLSGNGYVITGGRGKTYLLQHIILGKKEGFEVDHINGNPLDNRKSNLRHVTRSENNINRKNTKGYWRTASNKWQAYIGKNHKKYRLGTFDTEQEAKQARKKAELLHFGNLF